MLTQSAIDAGQLLSSFTAKHSNAGGIVSFSGNVRTDSQNGTVSALYLQAYAPLTSRGIEAAKNAADANWPLRGICIVHRIGDIKSGETIVFVAAAAKHRRAAFEAADFLMDYLKTKAVFWKKETTDKGAFWIEPRAADYEDALRWTAQNLEMDRT